MSQQGGVGSAIWGATLSARQAALDAAPDAKVRAVGITNQRETAVL